jgi:hypothetical protein
VLIWREGKTGYAGKWTSPYKLLSIDRKTCTVTLPKGPTSFRTTIVKLYQEPINENDIDNSKANPSKATQETIPKATPPNKEQDHTDRTELAILQLRPVVEILLYRPKAYIQATYETPEHQFAESRRKEINGLMEKGVFEAIDLKDIPPGVRIFNLRFVDEIKNPRIDKAFKKSRLVVQAYNDANKSLVLTESPMIQRCSQRLILCLAPCKKDSKLYL